MIFSIVFIRGVLSGGRVIYEVKRLLVVWVLILGLLATEIKIGFLYRR